VIVFLAEPAVVPVPEGRFYYGTVRALTKVYPPLSKAMRVLKEVFCIERGFKRNLAGGQEMKETNSIVVPV